VYKPVRTLILLIVTFTAAVSFRNDFLYFLLGFELMVMTAAWLQCLYISRHIRLTAHVPCPVAVKGQSFKIYARLENSGIFPVGRINARLALQWYPERESMLVTGLIMLAGHESGEICFEIDPAHCGCMDIRADALEVSDSLGIIKRRCAVDNGLSYPLYVIPDVEDISSDLPESELEKLDDNGSAGRRGEEEPDVNEIHAYHEGDSIRLVHWKLYARLSELLVREMADSVEILSQILLDLGERRENGIRSFPEEWDRFVETVAFVSSSMLKRDKQHIVAWADCVSSELIQYKVTDGASLNTMLCGLLRAQTYTAEDRSQLLREIRKDETKGTIIEIDLQGNITCTKAAG